MVQGTIRRLVHISSETYIASTHSANVHHEVGYGYIASPDGDVFFDDFGLTNYRFDQLEKGMVVEYVLEKAAYRRAVSVTVVDNRKNTDQQDTKVPRLTVRPVLPE